MVKRYGGGNQFGVDFEVYGYSNAFKAMVHRGDKLSAAAREWAREAGRITVKALKNRAPKKTRLFAEGIYYRTYARADGYEVRFYTGGEHSYVLPFLRDGTRAHEIPTGGAPAQMAKGYPLRFYWEKGPRGPGIYRFWRVWHPGTKKSPFVEQAREDASKEVREVLKNLVFLAWL